MSVKYSEFTTQGEIEEACGLSGTKLRHAIKVGLLREGLDYRLTRISETRFKYRYHLRSVIGLAPEINLAWRKRPRPNYRKDLKRVVERYTRLPSWTSTSKKRQLAEKINELKERERAIIEEWAVIQGQVRTWEAVYAKYIWERPDCPYCLGAGLTLNGKLCTFCDERKENESEDDGGEAKEAPEGVAKKGRRKNRVGLRSWGGPYCLEPKKG